jgi:asparagine synthase (glutamine-hydrolysing)
VCGFVGVASRNASKHKWLECAAKALRHRGPDYLGSWVSSCSRVHFWHSRLKIIDLSESANQPFLSEDGTKALVFNGEIYNYIHLSELLARKGHKFKSNSDTEVVLKAYEEWGDEFLYHLEGMFSIAIFDQNNMSLMLARDRAGEKPLFYFNDGVDIYFASELKSLLSNPVLPRRISQNALSFYLYVGYVPNGDCILDGFNKLAPAEYLVFNLSDGRVKKSKYWQPSYANLNINHKTISQEKALPALLESFNDILTNVIRRQLVADVPLGIFLSGGLDSSIITAFAAQQIAQVATFNVSFPEYGRFDEANYARQIAKHFGTNHHEIAITTKSMINFDDIIAEIDEPFIDSSFIPTYLLCKEVSNFVKLALGGDGADELFGGYDHYTKILKLNQIASYFPNGFRKLVSYSSKNLLPLGIKGKSYFDKIADTRPNSAPLVAFYFDEILRKKLLGKKATTDEEISEIIESSFDGLSLIERLTINDFSFFLPNDILTKIDKASMANSLEVRSPFLDVNVINFALGTLPARFKACGGVSKPFLRKVAEKLLPRGYDINRKNGFNLPLREWLKGGVVCDLFKRNLLSDNSIFDKGTVSNLFCQHSMGFDHTERLFGLLVLQIWCERHNVEVSFEN